MKIFGLNNRHNSVFYSWFVSYLTILVVPLILSGIIYKEASSIVEKDIINSNKAMLTQMQQTIDRELESIQKLSIQISLNNKLPSLLYAHEPLTENDNYNMLKLVEDFNTYKISNSSIKNFYIYCKNNNIVLSSGSVYDKSMAFRFLHEEEGDGLTFTEWTGIMNKNYPLSYILLKKAGVKNPNATVALVQSLPINSSGFTQASLVILLDNKILNKALNNVKWQEKGNAFIVDSNNEIVATSNDRLPNITLEHLSNIDGLQTSKIDGKEYAISYVDSKVTSWKFVSYIPSEVFIENITYIKRVTLISLFLCIVGGAALAYLFTRKNYSPLKDLVHNITNKINLNKAYSYNEYKVINETLYKEVNQNSLMNEQLHKQNKALKSSFLNKLLNGKTEYYLSIEDTMDSYEISFESNKFMVALFYLDENSQMFYSNESENLSEFIVINVMQEIMNKNFYSIVLEANDLIACIINFDKDKYEDINKVEASLYEGQSFLREHLKISTTISLSNVHETLVGIHEAYKEAMDAMEYKMVQGNLEIIKYEDVKKASSNLGNYSYNLELETRLINTIKAGDFEKSCSIINQVFEDNFTTKKLSIHIAKCLMLDLVSTFIKTLEEIKSSDEEILTDRSKDIEKLINCKTSKDMKIQLYAILEDICNYITNRKKSGSREKIKEAVTSFININYADPNMSIAMVAEKMDMHPNYISSLFKEYSGEGIIDYINKVRLIKAKELLAESEFNIGEIGDKVGYYNSNAFIRVFKKYEGITPGQFRNMNTES